MDFIFSIFRRTPEAQIARLRKKVKEPHGDPSVRIGAAQKLSEMGTPQALRALLDRFTINVSPSSQDEKEKEEVLSWLVHLGEKCVDPISDYLKNERQVYWPVRALKEILPAERLAGKLNEILRFHWDFPPADPDPKTQLIRALDKIHSRQLEETVRLYLHDDDDDVRLAALEYLCNCPGEEAREAVLQCYVDSSDRPRIRREILDLLAERQWSVKGFRPTVEESLPEGYTLTREGLVKRMGEGPLG